MILMIFTLSLISTILRYLRIIDSPNILNTFIMQNHKYPFYNHLLTVLRVELELKFFINEIYCEKA